MILPIIALLLVLGWVDIQHDIITGTVLVGLGVSGGFAWIAWRLLRYSLR